MNYRVSPSERFTHSTLSLSISLECGLLGHKTYEHTASFLTVLRFCSFFSLFVAFPLVFGFWTHLSLNKRWKKGKRNCVCVYRYRNSVCCSMVVFVAELRAISEDMTTVLMCVNSYALSLSSRESSASSTWNLYHLR